MPRARAAPRPGAPVAPGYVAYVRVSTDKQGRSGLGLDAQRTAIGRYIESAGGRLVSEYQEVESGTRRDRPELALALAACRARRATLIIAKLDRLARDTAFLLSVVRGAGEGGIVFCDLPQLPPGPAGAFVLTLFAAVAELEAGLISQRTIAAMAAAKARGVKMGNPRLRPGSPESMAEARRERTRLSREHAADVLPYIESAKKAGAVSLREIAEALTARGIRPPSGGDRWHASQVRRIMGPSSGPGPAVPRAGASLGASAPPAPASPTRTVPTVAMSGR